MLKMRLGMQMGLNPAGYYCHRADLLVVVVVMVGGW